MYILDINIYARGVYVVIPTVFNWQKKRDGATSRSYDTATWPCHHVPNGVSRLQPTLGYQLQQVFATHHISLASSWLAASELHQLASAESLLLRMRLLLFKSAAMMYKHPFNLGPEGALRQPDHLACLQVDINVCNMQHARRQSTQSQNMSFMCCQELCP